jgi:hypothetical protein
MAGVKPGPTPDVKGGPVRSPYMAGNWADYQGFYISCLITFDETTRTITQIDTHRDQECQFSSIAVGIGPDGTPDSSPIRWTCPVGDYTSTVDDLAWLASVGVTTIEQFNSYQITAVQ